MASTMSVVSQRPSVRTMCGTLNINGWLLYPRAGGRGGRKKHLRDGQNFTWSGGQVFHLKKKSLQSLKKKKTLVGGKRFRLGTFVECVLGFGPIAGGLAVLPMLGQGNGVIVSQWVAGGPPPSSSRRR